MTDEKKQSILQRTADPFAFGPSGEAIGGEASDPFAFGPSGEAIGGEASNTVSATTVKWLVVLATVILVAVGGMVAVNAASNPGPGAGAWDRYCRALIGSTYGKPASEINSEVNTFLMFHPTFKQMALDRGYRYVNEIFRACGGTIVG